MEFQNRGLVLEPKYLKGKQPRMKIRILPRRSRKGGKLTEDGRVSTHKKRDRRFLPFRRGGKGQEKRRDA